MKKTAITTIGMIELNSIARGIEVTDTLLKAADTKLIFSKPVCPGKYMTLIYGDVGAVKTAIDAGLAVGKNFVVDELVIPHVHEQIIPAINAGIEIGDVAAVGAVEYFNVAGAITGADAATKAAAVRLLEIRLGMGVGGKSFVTLCGDVSAVQSAVKAALYDAGEKGSVISSCVIPSPSPDLFYGLV